MATYSSILAWEIPQIEEPGRLQPIALQRIRHDWSDLAHMLPRRLAPSGNTDQSVCMWTIHLALGTMLGLPECLSVSPETGERRQLLESLGNLSSATRTFQQPQPSSCNLLSPQHTILFLPPRWVFAHGNAHLAWSPWEVAAGLIWILGTMELVDYNVFLRGASLVVQWVRLHFQCRGCGFDPSLES